MNTINWQVKAIKQLRKLDPQAQKAIRDGVNRLFTFPASDADVIKLTDHAYPYRLRVGNYRVFFSFDGGVKVLTIEEVKKRDEQTY